MESAWTSLTASWAAEASGSATTAPRVSASLAGMAPRACLLASMSSSACVEMASKVRQPAQALGGRGAGQSLATLAHAHSPPPSTGDICEHEENPCKLREPCLHGGTCQGTHCLCPPGFSGPRCQRGNCPSFSLLPFWGRGAGQSTHRCLCQLLEPAFLYRLWTWHSGVRLASRRQRGQWYVFIVAS